MRYQLTSRGRLHGQWAQPGDEDGPAPHTAPRAVLKGARKHGGEQRPEVDRKALQLCHQVAVTLDEVLAECGDTVLQNLRVLDVTPAPDTSRLLVTVAVEHEPIEDESDLHRVYEHLTRASGHLRSEVATAITRKRTPVLVYCLAAGAPMSEV
jgi:ribosome-binding factor A